MASISSVINASSIYAYEAQQNTPKQKPVQTRNPADVVQLSKAALAALGGSGDADHDGDSR
mgnify:FL=1